MIHSPNVSNGVRIEMKKPLLIGAVTVVAFATLANVGLRLIGAGHQIAAIASAPRAHRPPASGPAVPEQAAGPDAGTVQTESVHVVRDVAPINPEPAAVEAAALPGSGFDPEGAIHAAAQQDPGLAELLNNPDPAVGAAIRDFVTSVEPTGAH